MDIASLELLPSAGRGGGGSGKKVVCTLRVLKASCRLSELPLCLQELSPPFG